MQHITILKCGPSQMGFVGSPPSTFVLMAPIQTSCALAFAISFVFGRTAMVGGFHQTSDGEQDSSEFCCLIADDSVPGSVVSDEPRSYS